MNRLLQTFLWIVYLLVLWDFCSISGRIFEYFHFYKIHRIFWNSAEFYPCMYIRILTSLQGILISGRRHVRSSCMPCYIFICLISSLFYRTFQKSRMKNKHLQESSFTELAFQQSKPLIVAQLFTSGMCYSVPAANDGCTILWSPVSVRIPSEYLPLSFPCVHDNDNFMALMD